jgi:cytochrome c-type biogenesis protein CcmE
MTPRQRRMVLVGVIITGIAAAAALALTAFQKNLLFFYSPSQVAAGEAPKASLIRLGGLVVEGSIARDAQDGLKVRFGLTDKAKTVTVAYRGILPDLFREGQGIVAQGRLGSDNVFEATEVLAKHDENYMPPEVADAVGKAMGEAMKSSQKAGTKP